MLATTTKRTNKKRKQSNTDSMENTSSQTLMLSPLPISSLTANTIITTPSSPPEPTEYAKGLGHKITEERPNDIVHLRSRLDEKSFTDLCTELTYDSPRVYISRIKHAFMVVCFPNVFIPFVTQTAKQYNIQSLAHHVVDAFEPRHLLTNSELNVFINATLAFTVVITEYEEEYRAILSRMLEPAIRVLMHCRNEVLPENQTNGRDANTYNTKETLRDMELRSELDLCVASLQAQVIAMRVSLVHPLFSTPYPPIEAKPILSTHFGPWAMPLTSWYQLIHPFHARHEYRMDPSVAPSVGYRYTDKTSAYIRMQINEVFWAMLKDISSAEPVCFEPFAAVLKLLYHDVLYVATVLRVPSVPELLAAAPDAAVEELHQGKLPATRLAEVIVAMAKVVAEAVTPQHELYEMGQMMCNTTWQSLHHGEGIVNNTMLATAVRTLEMIKHMLFDAQTAITRSVTTNPMPPESNVLWMTVTSNRTEMTTMSTDWLYQAAKTSWATQLQAPGACNQVQFMHHVQNIHAIAIASLMKNAGAVLLRKAVPECLHWDYERLYSSNMQFHLAALALGIATDFVTHVDEANREMAIALGSEGIQQCETMVTECAPMGVVIEAMFESIARHPQKANMAHATPEAWAQATQVVPLLKQRILFIVTEHVFQMWDDPQRVLCDCRSRANIACGLAPELVSAILKIILPATKMLYRVTKVNFIEYQNNIVSIIGSTV